MISFKPSPRQALAIFSMVFGRSDAERQPDMRTLGLKPADRTLLVQHDLLELDKATRGQRASLTELAWAWAGNNLLAKLDQRSPAGRTLADVLARLDGFLRLHDTPLSEFAATTAERTKGADAKTGDAGAAGLRSRSRHKSKKSSARTKTSPAKSKSKSNQVAAARLKSTKLGQPTKGKTARPTITNQTLQKLKTSSRKKNGRATGSTKTRAKSARSATARNVRVAASKVGPAPANTQTLVTGSSTTSAKTSVAKRIRSEALALSGGATRKRVRLRDLRARLTDVPREQVDQELFALATQGRLVLYRIDDTNDLNDADNRAALMVAGNPRHVLYLEDEV